MGVEPQQCRPARVGERDQRKPFGESGEHCDGVGPRREPATGQGELCHGGRVVDSGGVGDKPGGFPVEGVAGQVGPNAVEDAALLAVDVLLPQGVESLDSGLVERRVEPADAGADTGGFVDERAEQVEDDGIDLWSRQGRSPERSRGVNVAVEGTKREATLIPRACGDLPAQVQPAHGPSRSPRERPWWHAPHPEVIPPSPAPRCPRPPAWPSRSRRTPAHCTATPQPPLSHGDPPCASGSAGR